MCILRGEGPPHCAVYWVKGGDSANTGPAARSVTKRCEQVSDVRIINTKARGMAVPCPVCLTPGQGNIFIWCCVFLLVIVGMMLYVKE